jgi:hypothetical protein
MIYNYLQRTRLISSHATQLGLCHGLAETARVSRCQGQRPTPRLGRPNSSGLGTPTQRRSALRQRRAWARRSPWCNRRCLLLALTTTWSPPRGPLALGAPAEQGHMGGGASLRPGDEREEGHRRRAAFQ